MDRKRIPIVNRIDLNSNEKRKLYLKNYRKLNKSRVKKWNRKYYLKHAKELIGKNTAARRKRIKSRDLNRI